jgi:phospholipase C
MAGVYGSAISRRSLLKSGLALGAGAATLGLSSSAGASLERAMAVDPPAKASLSDIRHVVFLMQENRSFDHYFGTMSAVRGFSDPHPLKQKVNGRTYPVFDQFGYQPGVGPDPSGYMQPFALQQMFPHRERRLHQRHHPRVGASAPELGQRSHGRVRAHPPGR